MASKSHSEKPEKEGEEGESSYEESEFLAGAQLKKSESRIMREQATRENINSTRALVAAYNQAETEVESKSLHQWLQRYLPYLDEGFAKHADDGVFEEMSCLAAIKPRYDEDKKLIRKTIGFLGKQVSDISLDQRKTTAALAEALQAVDESVFDGDIVALLKLSNVLLTELDVEKTAFVEGTHSTHITTLFALHQALLIVQRMTASTADFSREQQWFQTFRTKLKNIADCQSHFSTYFQVKMVEQCLEHLVSFSPISQAYLSRRMASIMSGCCYLYSGVRKALAADIDLDSFLKAFKSLKEESADYEHRREWYVQYLKLNGAALLSSQSTDFDNDFVPSLQEAMDAQAEFSKREDANLLRFGIILQLSYATLHGKSPDFCMRAMIELVNLATRYATYEGWDNEPAIIDAILAALRDAHSTSLLEETAEIAVSSMKSSDSQAIRERVEQWLNGRTIKDKLQEHAIPNTQFVECRYLFNIVRRSAGLYSNEEQICMVEELAAAYKLPEFSKIPGLVDEQAEKDVANFKFHIVYAEDKKNKISLCRRDKTTIAETEEERIMFSLKEDHLKKKF